MKPFAIYRKTMIFSWLKLGIGLMCLCVCLAIAGIAWLIISKMAFDILTSIAIGCGAFLIAVGLYFLIMSKLGYGIRMGHLAIIERAHGGEDVPSNPVEFSKGIVQKRFGSNRQFYLFDRSIMIVQREIRRVLARGFTLDSDVPSNSSSLWVQLLCHPALSCLDECCLAYALRHKDDEVNAACVDAMTILVQAWPQFLSKARIISIQHLLLCLVTFAVFFVPGFLISRDLGIETLTWLGIAFLITLTVKVAFYDSYVLTKVVYEFLGIANETEVDPKCYKKLDSWSKGYKKLRKSAGKAVEKAEAEELKEEIAAKKQKDTAEDGSPDAEESAETEEPTDNIGDADTEGEAPNAEDGVPAAEDGPTEGDDVGPEAPDTTAPEKEEEP